MSDYIDIEGLLVRAIVGINPEERVNRQDVVIDLRLSVDLRQAAKSDSIEDAVNYRTLTKAVIAFVEASQFQLIEKLADEIARLCLSDPRVLRVRVRLQKPGAVRFARTVGVVLERGRTDD
ncbi:MAG: dihydroneopterin aldolase [Planctomyces sp.]|nr:dihydroneopterin aldolase [Planctomyces sp.]